MLVLKIVTGRRYVLFTGWCIAMVFLALNVLNTKFVVVRTDRDAGRYNVSNILNIRLEYDQVKVTEVQNSTNISQNLYEKVLIDGSMRKPYGGSDVGDISNCTGSYKKIVTQHPPDEECQKRLPKAIVVGIQKSGTMALLYFLSRHPEISAVLEPTELNYFTRYRDEPLEFYRNKMNCSFSNQISIEKSPMYYYCKACPSLIKQVDQNMKIIIIVKEPIDRALSYYSMKIRLSRRKPDSFEETVIDSNGNVRKSNTMISFSSYAHYMSEWLQYFSLSQIHFIDGHHFESNPAVELNRLEEFLGVGSYFTCDKFMYNATKKKFCLKTDSYAMECLHDGKGNDHLDLSDNVLKKLQDYFCPLNQEFFEMIDRRFDWGY